MNTTLRDITKAQDSTPYAHGSPLSSSQASPYPYSFQASATASSTQPTFSYAHSLSWGSPSPPTSDVHSPIEEDAAIEPEHSFDPQLMSTCVGSPVSVPYQGPKPSQAVHEAFYEEPVLSRHAAPLGKSSTSMGRSHLSQASTSEQQMPLYASGRMQHDAYGNTGEFTQPDHLSPSQNPQLPLNPNAAAPAVNSGQGTTTSQSSIKCEKCPMSFKPGKCAKPNLDRHIRNEHPNKPPIDFVCLRKKTDGSDCNTKFVNLNNLMRHLRNTHKTAIASNPGRNKVDRTFFEHMFQEVPRSPLTVEAD